MILGQISKKAREQFLEKKRIVWLIESDKFARAFVLATETQKKELLKRVNNHKKLLALVSQILKKDLHNLPTTQLRELGRKYCIKYYYTKARTDLIKELEEWLK